MIEESLSLDNILEVSGMRVRLGSRIRIKDWILS